MPRKPKAAFQRAELSGALLPMLRHSCVQCRHCCLCQEPGVDQGRPRRALRSRAVCQSGSFKDELLCERQVCLGVVPYRVWFLGQLVLQSCLTLRCHKNWASIKAVGMVAKPTVQRRSLPKIAVAMLQLREALDILQTLTSPMPLSARTADECVEFSVRVQDRLIVRSALCS